MTVLATRRRVCFTVLGHAQPKGSARGFVPKGWTRPIITSDNPRTKEWEQRIATEAQHVGGDLLFTGPVLLVASFYLPRPKTGKAKHHMTRPDADKLARCVLDALSGVLYHDDGQVVQLHVRKQYAGIAAAPCARIVVEDAVDPEPTVRDLIPEGNLFA